MLRYYLVETTLLIRFGERLGSGLNGIVQVWGAVYCTLPTISEKTDADRTILILPTNGQKPDAVALREFYDEVDIQDAEDEHTIKQEREESHTGDKEMGENNVTENVTENRLLLILEEMKKNTSITTTDLARILHVTRRTIHRDIDLLKQQGLLTRIGPDKGGNWKVIEENMQATAVDFY